MSYKEMTEEGTPLERDAAWSLMVALVAPLTCQVEVLNFHLHANTGMYLGLFTSQLKSTVHF